MTLACLLGDCRWVSLSKTWVKCGWGCLWVAGEWFYCSRCLDFDYRCYAHFLECMGGRTAPEMGVFR